MRDPVRLHNGNIRVPARMESDGALGDGMQEIGPDHEHYAPWDNWMTQQGMGKDEVFRYGVDDVDADLPPGIISHHDSVDYPGGIVTYATRFNVVKAKELSLVPIYPDHHESTVVQEMSKHLGGLDELMKMWNNLSRLEQSTLLRQIADKTGESIWTLQHEIQKLGGM